MDDQFTGPVAPQPSVTSSQQPIPPTAPKTSHKKKIIIFVVIALILIVAAAFGAYQFEHSRAVKAENRQQSQIDSLKKQINSSQKSKADTGSTTPTNPYAGWKSYTLKYEELTFKYPSSWRVKDFSNGPNGIPNADNVDFEASDGFNFDIINGMKPGGDPTPLASDSPWPVTFADRSAYLVFSHPRMAGLTNQDPNSIGGMRLLTNPKDQYSWPTDKNVFSTSTTNGGGSNIFINAQYSTSSGPKYFSTVQQAMNDPEYKNAKLVIESMHY